MYQIAWIVHAVILVYVIVPAHQKLHHVSVVMAMFPIQVSCKYSKRKFNCNGVNVDTFTAVACLPKKHIDDDCVSSAQCTFDGGVRFSLHNIFHFTLFYL